MAKAANEKKEKKAKAPEFKDVLYGKIGATLANGLDIDVMRVKVEGMSECLLLTGEDGKDYTITVTQKKANVEYEEDHVKKTFAPGCDENGEIVEEEENAE